MEKSESIKNLAKALIMFHEKCATIARESENPFFKSSYASLANIQESIKEPLQYAGLAYSQLPEMDNVLTTILMHSESGEYIQCSYNMKPVKDDPQGKGSCITYQKRYALAAVLGLCIDDDDDGNAASNPPQRKNNQPPQQPKPEPAQQPLPEPMATEAQKKTIINLIADSSITETEHKQMFDSLPKLTEARAKTAIAKLQKTIQERTTATE